LHIIIVVLFIIVAGIIIPFIIIIIAIVIIIAYCYFVSFQQWRKYFLCSTAGTFMKLEEMSGKVCQDIMSVEKEMRKSLNINAFCEFMLANAQNDGMTLF
jgi:hypothetical protein